MKILVATKETQGKRKNDFCWCEEGEFLIHSMECDGEGVDGHCGCKRSLCSIKTGTATTTMKVIESDLKKDGLVRQVIKHLEVAGWAALLGKEKTMDLAVEEVMENMRMAMPFKVGNVVERRGHIIQSR